MIDYLASFTNTDGAAFPNTKGKNASSPGATDGTEFVKLMIDDEWGARQALLNDVGLTPDGVTEAPTTSQFVESIRKLASGSACFYTDTGVADAYDIALTTGNVPIPAYFNGMRVKFRPANSNTGASTVDVSGLGVKDIKFFGNDPAANVIKAGITIELEYNVSTGDFDIIGQDAYVKVSDAKASGTVGGAATVGSYQKRDINTEDNDDAALATIATNQITLEAGTYEVEISVPGYRVDTHKAQLYDTTGAAVLVLGSSERSEATTGVNIQTRSIIKGKFTIAVQSVLEVQQWVTTNTSTSDLGTPVSFGDNEVYTIAEFWRKNNS